jgi:hypothetical protein
MRYRIEERDAGADVVVAQTEQGFHGPLNDKAAAWEQFRKELKRFPNRYEANGRYRLVLVDRTNHIGGVR